MRHIPNNAGEDFYVREYPEYDLQVRTSVLLCLLSSVLHCIRGELCVLGSSRESPTEVAREDAPAGSLARVRGSRAGSSRKHYTHQG